MRRIVSASEKVIESAVIREFVVQAAKNDAICLIVSSSLSRALLQIKDEFVSFFVTLLLTVSFFKGIAFMDRDSQFELQPVNKMQNTSKKQTDPTKPNRKKERALSVLTCKFSCFIITSV